jgi:prepilin-type N-terminal cleavage/methylation domain-containing protein
MHRKIPGIRDQRGFTLIEIIMVIVLLGIIAAIAIPKYVDLKTAAVDATLEGLKGGLTSASAIGYADLAINTSAATYPTAAQINTSYLTSDDLGYNASGYWTSNVGNTVYNFTYTQSSGSFSYGP